jgi:hypothetical protein
MWILTPTHQNGWVNLVQQKSAILIFVYPLPIGYEAACVVREKLQRITVTLRWTPVVPSDASDLLRTADLIRSGAPSSTSFRFELSTLPIDWQIEPRILRECNWVVIKLRKLPVLH